MTQMIEVMDHFTSFLGAGEPVAVIYLDFKKEFNTGPHQRLLIKLQPYDITGNVLRWSSEFLSGRSQSVRVGSSSLSSTPVLSGIHQGSILGPILFKDFINDLPAYFESICKMFGDDTKKFGDDTKVFGDDKRKKKKERDFSYIAHLQAQRASQGAGP